MAVVSEPLRGLLATHSMTRLAKLLKVSRPNLSNVVNGKRYLSVDMALRIEQKFGLDARRLLHDQLDEQITAEKDHVKNRLRPHAVPRPRPARPRRYAGVGVLRVGR
jgi:addiction module HigA family antidote